MFKHSIFLLLCLLNGFQVLVRAEQLIQRSGLRLSSCERQGEGDSVSKAKDSEHLQHVGISPRMSCLVLSYLLGLTITVIKLFASLQ